MKYGIMSRIQEIQRIVEASKCPDKGPLLNYLKFFLRQTQCDYDRRVDFMTLSKSWNEFNVLLNKNPEILNSVSAKCWNEVEAFLGIMPHLKRSAPFRSKFDNMRLTDILDYLKNRIESSIPEGLEQKAIRYAMNYLKCQAESKERDQKEIQKTWKDIYPALAKRHILDELKADTRASSEFKYFLSGKI